MLAVLLALASAAGFGGSDYAAGLAARRASVIRITILAEAVSVVFLILVLPLAGLRAPSLASLGWGAAGGLSGGLGALALYAGFRHAAFSVVGPLSAIGAAGFSVLAGLLLGERPGMLAMIGVALALPAIVGVSASPGSAGPGSASPGSASPGSASPGSGSPGKFSAGPAGPDAEGSGQAGAARSAPHAGAVTLGRGAGGWFRGAVHRAQPGGCRQRTVASRRGSGRCAHRGGGPGRGDRTSPATAQTSQVAGHTDRSGRRGRDDPVFLRDARWPAGGDRCADVAVPGGDHRARPGVPRRAAHRDQAGWALPGGRLGGADCHRRVCLTGPGRDSPGRGGVPRIPR